MSVLVEVVVVFANCNYDVRPVDISLLLEHSLIHKVDLSGATLRDHQKVALIVLRV